MKSSKKTLAIVLFVIAAILVAWWAMQGAAFFTSTERQVMVHDDLLDVDTPKWEKDFTPGLELVGPLTAVCLIGGAWLMYSTKKQQRLQHIK